MYSVQAMRVLKKRAQDDAYIIMRDQLSWLEHLPYKQGVTGSNPVFRTTLRRGHTRERWTRSGAGDTTNILVLLCKRPV